MFPNLDHLSQANLISGNKKEKKKEKKKRGCRGMDLMDPANITKNVLTLSI
jgi:hypothetical protein